MSRAANTEQPERRRSRGVLPGLATAGAVAAVAVGVSGALSALGVEAVSDVFLAIVLGLSWRRFGVHPPALEAGVRFAVRRVLRVAIVLLGLRFSLGAVGETGGAALLVIVAGIGAAFAAVYVLSRFVDVPGRLVGLIGIGTAVCGNSAIAATAPVIGAREEEVTFASTTITLFGTAAMLAYPFVGEALGLTSTEFGVFAGVGVHDSAQAIASGFIFGPLAGGEATIVKLTRTVFLVPVLFGAGLVAARSATVGGSGTLRSAVPWFAVGFVALSAGRTLGDAVFDGAGAWSGFLDVTESLSAFLIVVAMAGIGLQTDLDRLRRIGAGPFLVGLGAAVTVGAVALALVRWG